MALTAGTKLGPYVIVAPLGAGGMGEVYRAHDARLGREVAIKVLPESLARDSERLQRFEQEARSVAALNHPNILAVFDVGQSNGSPFLVSELLDGETLRSVLDRGALPQRKTIDYGVQIAQGLAAAHEKGIVHRDLKPENIFVTKDGRVKILDFGLAKLAQPSKGPASEGFTLTSAHTAMGVVMGTANYMAPEQVRGEPVDPRTDIFAFGAVLYEMLSGKRAFRGESPAETMTAVVKEEPAEFVQASHAVSPALERIIRRCLEKAPDQRFQSARDLSFALGALSGTDSSAAPRIAESRRKSAPLLLVSVALAFVLASAITWMVARRPVAGEPMQFAIPVSGEVGHIALSRDGKLLAFVQPAEDTGIPMLFVQRIGSGTANVLAGTEGASYPFWSPDASFLGFFANGKMLKIPAAGGTPSALASVESARGGSWGSGGVIVFAPDSGSPLWRVNADGTGLAPVTDHLFVGSEQSHRWPVFLPDGKHFLFWGGNFGNVQNDHDSGIFLSSLDGKEKKLVALAHSSFALSADRLFFADDDRHLVSVGFDAAKGTTYGNVNIIANVVAAQPATYWAALTASTNGTLIYDTETGASQSVMTWMDRTGKLLGKLGEPAVQCNPTISPDGSRVAVDISDEKANNVNIWFLSTTGATSSRFTFDPTEEVVGVWSRDGKQVAYRSAGTGVGYGALLLKPASGLEHERTLMKIQAADDVVPNSWTPDDKEILITHQSPTGYHLELVPVAGGQGVPFQKDRGNQINGQISPDGKWAAYASDESGTWEVYVTTFPAGAGKWQVSRGGGTEPRWRGDSKEIFYLAPGGMITAVPVSAEGEFSTGTPTPLFQFHGRAAISSTDTFSYDVTKDGKRFLVNRYVKPEKITPLTIILNAGAGQKS